MIMDRKIIVLLSILGIIFIAGCVQQSKVGGLGMPEFPPGENAHAYVTILSADENAGFTARVENITSHSINKADWLQLKNGDVIIITTLGIQKVTKYDMS